MTEIRNFKSVLVIETGDPPAGWESEGQICNLQSKIFPTLLMGLVLIEIVV